jgi:hypothetical protein
LTVPIGYSATIWVRLRIAATGLAGDQPVMVVLVQGEDTVVLQEEVVAEPDGTLLAEIVGAGGGFPDQRLEFGEGHFDRVEIGAVWRQEQEPCADIVQGCRCGRALVAGEIVQDDHIAGPECRDQLGFGVEIEHLGVHRPVDHPGRVQPVMAQGGDKGLGAPMPERCMIDEALPARRPSCGLGHVCLEGGLINES